MSNKWRKKPEKKRPVRGRKAASPKPDVKCVSSSELKEIVKKAGTEAITEGEQENLDAAIETLAWVTSELDNKTLTLRRLRSLFGMNTSEKTDKVFPDDASKDKDPDKAEPAEDSTGPSTEPSTEPKSDGEDPDVGPGPKPKPKGHGRNGAADYTDAENVDVPHESLRPGDPCPECKGGKVYERKDRPRLVIRVRGQAPLHATVYRLQSLRCHLCGKIFTAKPPDGVGDAKYDASAASMIALLKYGNGLPFNRLQGLQRNLGIPLPATTQWGIVEEAAAKLTPIHEELIRQAAQGEIIHNDDTSMRVLSHMKAIEDERRASEELGERHRGRVGIFCSGLVSVGDHRIFLFFTGRKHAGENLGEVLKARAQELSAPILMCDGLSRNEPADAATVVANCLAHARRKFVDAKESFPVEVRHVLEQLGLVYRTDAEAKEEDLSDQERLLLHQRRSRKVMDDLRKWMHALTDERKVEENSSLGQAIAYMERRWDKLTRFLVEPGAPLDNNVCERALKKVILHRKNALFYKTENGARVGDLFMTLIYTAEIAKANPFDYLAQLLRHPEAIARDPANWMPWSYRDSATSPTT